MCTTRTKTGVGYPQLSAVIECADSAHGLKGHIISVSLHVGLGTDQGVAWDGRTLLPGPEGAQLPVAIYPVASCGLGSEWALPSQQRPRPCSPLTL